ncbi:MAG: hypothetical protein V3R99_01220 [Thermoguttaceae bacterium]
MKYLPENELFSAYLDGELTAEEQAQVERILADSPAARQLLDELRALSSTLQSLPQHKLDEDLSEAVLRNAEREILTRPVPFTPTKPSRRLPDWRRFVNSRSLAWSGMAVAVAIMLMVFGPKDEQRPAGLEVAQAPESDEARGVEDDRLAEDQPVGGRPVEDRPVEDRPVEPPSIRAVADLDPDESVNGSLVEDALSVEEPRDSTVDSPVGGMGGGGMGGMGYGVGGGGAVAKKGGSGRVEDPLPEISESVAVAEEPAGKQGEPPTSLTRKPAFTNRQVEAPGRGAATARHGFAIDIVNGPDSGAGPGPGFGTTPIVAKGQSAGSYSANDAISTAPSAGPRQTLADKAHAATQPMNSGGQLFADVQRAQNTSGHATVFCDISAEVLREGNFVRLLGSNNIAVEETALGRNLQLKKLGGAQAVRVDLSKELDAVEPRHNGVELSLGSGLEARTVTLDEATIAQWGDVERLDVFYVVATAAQIQATLNDLGRQSDTFLALSVKQDPGVQQQKRQYDDDHSNTRGSSENISGQLSQVQPPARDRMDGETAKLDESVGAHGRAKGMAAGDAVAEEDAVAEKNDSNARGVTVPDGGTFRLGGIQIDGQLRRGLPRRPTDGQAPAQSKERGAEALQRPPSLPEPATQPGSPTTPPTETAVPETAVPETAVPETAAPDTADSKAIARQSQQAVPAAESAPSAPKQPADHGEKTEGGLSPEAGASDQHPTEQEETPGNDVRGRAKSGLATRPPPTTDEEESADGTGDLSYESQRVRGSQSATALQPAPNSQLGVDGLLHEEATYRVLFVLRVVGGESSGPADAAASIIASDADSQTGPALPDPQPSNQSPVEPSPAQVPATEAPPTEQQ